MLNDQVKKIKILLFSIIIVIMASGLSFIVMSLYKLGEDDRNKEGLLVVLLFLFGTVFFLFLIFALTLSQWKKIENKFKNIGERLGLNFTINTGKSFYSANGYNVKFSIKKLAYDEKDRKDRSDGRFNLKGEYKGRKVWIYASPYTVPGHNLGNSIEFKIEIDDKVIYGDKDTGHIPTVNQIEEIINNYIDNK